MQRSKMGEFHWTDLSAKDFNAQSAFYEALFGWTYTDMPFGQGQTYRMYKKDGHTVAAISQLAPEMLAGGAPSMWNSYLAVDDVDATAAKAVELGGTIAMPPMDVPGSGGRMAAIQDPTGGFIFFWKPARLDETMTYFEPGVLSWNDLYTRDPDKAATFYSALVGWNIEPRTEAAMPYWQINVDGQGEGGMMPMPDMIPPEVPSFWMPYFGSSDVRADVARAAELGASVQVEPTQVGDMVSFAILTDPMGATFALVGTPTGAPSA